MYLVTTETIADQKISEVKGAIFNEQVISVNIVKDAISGIKGIFGGKSTTYSEEYSKGRKLALVELEEQAHRLSANAIVNTHISYNQFVNSDIMLIVVTASGTAVVVED
ncbi:YbjQ family protein [Enterococcus casseliflavus]|uniref:YbjQ family protein n=1 Tax=Enterococcus casseliflavus TaxID=37734 RepID=UPI002DB89F8E|nr:YbjQ family protein [Enterococcus casseliflavus]MEB6181944.1 YbjQ family protein [Enterococcus casseliflavus]